MNNRKAPMNFYLLQKPGTKGTRPSDYFVNSLHFPGKYRDIHIHAIEVLPNEPSAEEVFERVKKDFETLKTALLKISVRCEGSMHQQDFHRIRELTHECFAAIAESRKV